MRERWEYKKIGDIATVVSGSTPQTSVEEFWGKGHYWVTPAELDDKTVYVSKTERQITDAALAKVKLQRLPKGTVLLSSRAPIGKVAICDVDMYCNQGFKNCICSDLVYNKYLFYFLKDKKEYLNSLGRGATFKEISKGIVEKVVVPLPPKPTQLSIVSELDKLNELIQIKKEQLKDYDALAQSIFYEMFGDPVVNDKKWEVKQLKDVSTLLNGRAYKQQELLDKGKYKVLRVGNFFTNSTFYYSDLELDDDKYCEYGDLLFAWSASFGAFIWNGDKVIYHYHIWKVLFDKDCLDIQYYRYLLNTMTSFFMNDVHGIGMVHLTKSGMEQYVLPIPPLPLQQSFAHKIEQIDRQKAAVQRTIKDLETLLAARMQYWFD